MNTNPEYAAMSLDFAKITEEGTAQRFTAVLTDDNSQYLSAVLPAIRDLLIAAGFTYVVEVAVETDSGTMIFSDEAI